MVVGQDGIQQSFVLIKRESHPIGRLSWEDYQEQCLSLLKGNTPRSQQLQILKDKVCITLLLLIPEPSFCPYPDSRHCPRILLYLPHYLPRHPHPEACSILSSAFTSVTCYPFPNPPVFLPHLTFSHPWQLDLPLSADNSTEKHYLNPVRHLS